MPLEMDSLEILHKALDHLDKGFKDLPDTVAEPDINTWIGGSVSGKYWMLYRVR